MKQQRDISELQQASLRKTEITFCFINPQKWILTRPETKSIFRSNSVSSFIFTTLEMKLQRHIFDPFTTTRSQENPVPSTGYFSTDNSTVGKSGRQNPIQFPNFSFIKVKITSKTKILRRVVFPALILH